MNIKTNKQIKQFNLLEILLYHLLPGIPILLITIICAGPTFGLHLPILLAVMIAVVLSLVPIQLLIIKIHANKNNQSFKESISYKNKMPLTKTLLYIVPCFLFTAIIFGLVGPIERPLWTIFNWVPQWFRLDQYIPDTSNSSQVILTMVLYFVFNGVLAPLTEELYFRGFLLPRMELFGKLAPVFSSILFSIYHFFSPWEIFTRIIAYLPIAISVWYKKDIRISIITHCSLNLCSCIGMLITILNM